MGLSSQNSYEIRLYGLHDSVSSPEITAFFSSDTPVLGVLIHPRNVDDARSTKWAQVWMSSEEQVSKGLILKDAFAGRGITITRWPNLTPESQHATLGVLTPPSTVPRGVPTIPSTPGTPIPEEPSKGPRNLYVLGIPINMTQQQFKALFTQFGNVEHSTLLSQLDGAGRRRGFVLMSTNHEAVLAMTCMNHKRIDGYEIDISWALVQRQAPQTLQPGGMPNRVVHPPADRLREGARENVVSVENLDSQIFPTASSVEQHFSWFGPIVRITMIPGNTHSAVITFQEKEAAIALLKTSGMRCGNCPIHVRLIQPSKFDPFEDLERPSSVSANPSRSEFQSLVQSFKFDPFFSPSLLQGMKRDPIPLKSTPTWPDLKGLEEINTFELH